MDKLIGVTSNKDEDISDTQEKISSKDQKVITKVMSPSITLGNPGKKATKEAKTVGTSESQKKVDEDSVKTSKRSKEADKEDAKTSGKEKTSTSSKKEKEATENAQSTKTRRWKRVAVKVMRLKDTPKVKGQRMGVLDSGATHPVQEEKKIRWSGHSKSSWQEAKKSLWKSTKTKS